MDSAMDAAGTAGLNGAGSMADQVAQGTRQVGQQVQQKAVQVMDQARAQVMTQLEGRKNDAAGALEGVAQALRETGRHLREHDQGTVAGYTDSAAEQIERWTGYARGHDVDFFVDQVTDYARSRPALFLGGAFALGLIAARFMKSTGRNMGQSAGGGADGNQPVSGDEALVPYASDQNPNGPAGLQAQARARPDTAAAPGAAGWTGSGSPNTGASSEGPDGARNDAAAAGVRDGL